LAAAAALAAPKALVRVLSERCKGCEICVVVCPLGNFRLSEELNQMGYYPVIWEYQGTKGPCNACALCYWVCPDLAIAEVSEVKGP
jgi:2-oxoglutarate ferredoxin oxidoreductase subunit delta